MRASAADARRQKKLGDQVDVVGSDIAAAHGSDPADRLVTAPPEPEIHVEAEVTGNRPVDPADLVERGRSRGRVQEEPDDVEQVRPLPGSSLGTSSSAWRTSRTSTLTVPYEVVRRTAAG